MKVQKLSSQLKSEAVEAALAPFGSLYGDTDFAPIMEIRRELAKVAVEYVSTPRLSRRKALLAGQIVEMVLERMGPEPRPDDPPDYNTCPAEVHFDGTYRLTFVTPTSGTRIIVTSEGVTVDFGTKGSETRAEEILSAAATLGAHFVVQNVVTEDN